MAGAATALLVFLRPLSRVPRTSGGTGAAREYKYKYKIYFCDTGQTRNKLLAQ
jgi:hypothetical protein